MKKLLCLFIALFCVFGFCSCTKKQDKKNNKDGVDLSYYAKIGQIPECKYNLGQSIDEMLDELKEKAESPDATEEDFYTEFQSGENTTVTVNGGDYLYKTADKASGIWAVVSYGDSFGFKIGTSPANIKESVEVFCEKSEERPLSGEERKVFSGNDGSTCLEYDFEKAKVVFAFEENGLFATAIFKN